nr:GNAT family N-acetyltransferase [candidate division Zixibacteria bacterium]
MDQIKKISNRNYRRFIDIVANSYPGFGLNTDESRLKATVRLLKVQRENPEISTWGYFRDRKLLGGIRLFDFVMTMFETEIPVGGGGLLAVDLLYKREKVARGLMEYFINHYLKMGTCLTTLYPFRPDFYRRMGWGYGAKYNEYVVKPGDFPDFGSKEHIVYLNSKDYSAVKDCYNRYAAVTHGMFRKCKYEFGYFGRPEMRLVGFKQGRRILGYLAFEFKQLEKDNFIRNDIKIFEFIYESREAFSELITFLHTQDDQINLIRFPTSDDHLHFIPYDPRDHSDQLVGMINHRVNAQGIGIMYRVIDTPGIFRQLKKHNFNNGNGRLKITINDSFLKSNNGSTFVDFVNGHSEVISGGKYDVEIKMDISDFSSMLMGVIDFESLYRYRRTEISDPNSLTTVNRIFKSDRKPQCTTQF